MKDMENNLTMNEYNISGKGICYSAFVLLILCVFWIILGGKSMSQIKPEWTHFDYILWLSDPDLFFILNYINATMITIVDVVLFFFLFNYLSIENKILAELGLLFIPIYGALNIVCYSIQISVVPSIAKNVLESSGDLYLATQLMQARPDTLIGYLNGLAYVILGIPSIIYGYLLLKRTMKLAGYTLMISGILSIPGLIGYFTGNKILSLGMVSGGVVFAISLVFLVIQFRRREV